MAVAGVKQVSSFSSRKEQAKQRKQKAGHQRCLKHSLGTMDFQRSPERGLTEGRLDTRNKFKHRQRGNIYNSNHRVASDYKVISGNGGLLLPIATAYL